MKKLIVVLLLFTITLFARINPFVPTESIQTVTNNNQEELEFFKQEQIYLPSTAKILKEIKIVYQNLDGSIEEVVKNVDKKIDWHESIDIAHTNSQTSKSFKKVTFKGVSFFSASISKKTVILNTTDETIRTFLMTKPYRIVIDFKNNSSFYSSSKKIKESFFKKIVIGKHDGYYRIVLYLDGYYDYKIDKQKKGYLIELKQ